MNSKYITLSVGPSIVNSDNEQIGNNNVIYKTHNNFLCHFLLRPSVSSACVVHIDLSPNTCFSLIMISPIQIKRGESQLIKCDFALVHLLNLRLMKKYANNFTDINVKPFQSYAVKFLFCLRQFDSVVKYVGWSQVEIVGSSPTLGKYSFCPCGLMDKAQPS